MTNLFQPGDRVQKAKGYRYDGVVIGASQTTKGETRYDVQVDSTTGIKRLRELDDKYRFTETEFGELYDLIDNCSGMIHIFSEEQLTSQKK